MLVLSLIELDVLAPARLSDRQRPPIQDEDEDVAEERKRIYEGGSRGDILYIKDLCKVDHAVSTKN